MNVLIILGWPLEHGGHMNSALCLGKNLVKSGDTVFICAPDGPKKHDFQKLGMTVITCEQLANPLPHNLASIPSLIKIIRDKKIDVVHAMDYQSLYPGFIAASTLGRKFLYTKAGGVTPKYIIPRGTHVVVYSGELLEGMQARYPHLKESLHLIKARIDTDLFHPLPPPSPGSDNDTLTIFMAMRLEESKRAWLETAINGIDALSRNNSSFIFQLAGDGGIRDEIEQRVKTINGNRGHEVIRLLGGISDINEMNRLYNKADIIIGHGRGILEAMACGKPVVATGKDHDVTLVCNDTVNKISFYNFSGRHTAHHPELSHNFVDVLDELLANRDQRDALKSFSLDYIANEYAADIGARNLQELYAIKSGPLAYRYLQVLVWVFDEIHSRIKRSFR